MRGVATGSFRATVAAPTQSARPGIARLKPLVEVGDDAMKYISPPVVIGGLTVVTHDTKLTDDMVRAGSNVKFNWGGPVVARY